MRSLFFTAALLAAASVATLAAPAPGDETPATPTIHQFLKIRTPRPPMILADGSLLTMDWPDGVVQLYRFTPGTGGEGGPDYRPEAVRRQRLTSYADGLASYSLSPAGRWVVLMHSRGGNEFTQLSLLDLDDPEAKPTPVLSNPRVQATVNVWLRDGSGFIYRANADSPFDFHLYHYDLGSGRTTPVLARPGAWTARDISIDGARLLVHQFLSASESRCYELDIASGALAELTVRPPDGTAANSIYGYLPGERAVLMESDANRQGIGRLLVRDLKSGAVREPLPALGRFELDGAGINETREYVAVVVNEDGYGVLRVYSLPDFKPLPEPTAERGVITPGGFRGRTLVWAVSNARTAASAYATTYPPRGERAAPVTRQVTWTETQGVDLSRFSLPELVRYPTFDGRMIPAFLFRPPGADKGTRVPFVVIYHGGPEGQHRPGFSAQQQYLLSRGFGLLLPNVRGSTGYGREFHMLDNYKLRWDSVRDGVAAAEWLVAAGHAEPGRIATFGGSYGGFMSVACLVEDQERVERGERGERIFGAGVNTVGIVNLKTFLELTADYRRALREAEYGPLSDPEFLASVSSIYRADKIVAPMFIAHGFNDPRVPVEEAFQLAAALKQRGRNPRVFIAPDEGHGFSKLDNRIYFSERVVAFLEETIGAGRAAAP